MILFFKIFLKIILMLAVLLGCDSDEPIFRGATLYYKQGASYADEGQYDKAISEYTKAIELNPKLAEAYHGRGAAYGQKGEYDKAILDFDKAIELNPRLVEAYQGRGYTYLVKGQYDKAISDFTNAIEMESKFAAVYYLRGFAHEIKGQYDKTIFDYDKAIEINSGYAKAYNGKAWIMATCLDARYRDGAKAVELAKKAVDLDPRATFWDTLAAAYAEAGKFEDAIITQEKAIDLLKKEGEPKSEIDLGMKRLKSFKAHKPWREKWVWNAESKKYEQLTF